MSPATTPSVTAVDFTAPGTVDPADFGLDGLTSAAARISVGLSPTSGLGPSRLGQVRRGDAASLQASGRSWFSLGTSGGAGVLMVDSSLAVVVADTLMGGRGSIEARPLTSVEERVLVPHLQRAVQPLSNAFSPSGLAPLEVREPGRGPLGLRGDMLIVEVVVDAASPDTQPLGSLIVAVPAPTVTRGTSSASPQGAAVLGEMTAFASVPLLFSVTTDPTRVPASSVHSLAVGDLLSLRHRCDHPLRACVEGMPVGRASLARTGDSLQAQISALLAERLDGSRPRHTKRAGLPAVLGAPIPETPTPESSNQEGEQENMMEPLEDTGDGAIAAALAVAEGALEGAGAMPVPSAGPAAAPLQQAANLGLLADVPVEVSVEVGRASISLKDAVSLGVGQVVTLDAEADSPATVLVNGRVVAKGQVVVVEDVYGVRITELVGD